MTPVNPLLPEVLADLHEAYPHIPLTDWDARLLLDALSGRLDEGCAS